MNLWKVYYAPDDVLAPAVSSSSRVAPFYPPTLLEVKSLVARSTLLS